MNDPHVDVLRYRLQVGPGVSYKPGTTVTWSTPEFDGEMTDGVLTLKMKTHHSTVGSAQSAVRDDLRAWEIQAGLDLGLGYLEFEFETSSIIDRDPPPPGSHVLHAEAGVLHLVGGTASCHITMTAYPTPPSGFSVSPIVSTMWQRYRGFLEGKELLANMGYFCLSVLQADAGGRKKVPAKYHIHADILTKLGELTSIVGDESAARKLDAHSTRRPHTAAEITWIQDVIKRLIRRAAELSANPGGPHVLVQMSDFPKL